VSALVDDPQPTRRTGAIRRGPSDQVLVERARHGDVRAFEQLVERHRDLVFRVAARIVGPDEAADVSQDAFLRAFNSLAKFTGEGPFRSWLLQITYNAALSTLSRRRPEPVDPQETGEDEGLVEGFGPAMALERSERTERMEGKIRLLRVEHRSVLVLRDVEGLSYEEIAGATETPIGSVKGRLHRARAELIELLRNNTYDWELPR
jgi:RNA polymerase sigma-70 factor, ECF subfamily